MPIFPWIVFWLLVCGGLLASLGIELALSGEEHIWKLIGFAILCFGVCHTLYWVCRKVTTDSALRAVDYLYLGLGFISIISVIDLQVTLLELKVPRIRAEHKIDYAPYMRCEKGLQVETFVLSPQLICSAESEVKSLLNGPYNHATVGQALGRVRPFYNSLNTSYVDYRPLFRAIDKLHADMERQVYSRLNPDKYLVVRRRLIALYLLCLAISIRIGRVTAEVFWRSKPEVKAA